MRLLSGPVWALGDARGHLFPFTPVLLGLGIGLWFALPWEPGFVAYAGIAGLAGGLALWAYRPPIYNLKKFVLVS